MSARDEGALLAGRYSLSTRIGRGGMGVVHRGTHVGTGRPVAIKLLEGRADGVACQRFLREARIASSISHPNLVSVLDVGSDEEHGMYLVLELLEGEPLDAHFARKGAMRVESALDTLVPILDALHALHEGGVVHRDVKPSNIFLSVDGTARVVPKLLDLGISRQLAPTEALTETGAMMGTPNYMSPEQARGSVELGIAIDIWAMGVVLFEALAGERPFIAETIPGLLHKIATDRPPRLGARAPSVPAGVAAEIDRALAYEPSSRHPSARALADALAAEALDVGCKLNCRAAAGPRLSLEMFAPARQAVPSDRTPLLGSPMTPVLGPPESSAPAPAEDVSVGDPRRPIEASAPPAAPRADAERSSSDAIPMGDVAAPSGTRDGPPIGEAATVAAPVTSGGDEPLSPSQKLRRVTPSPLRLVLPVLALLIAAAAGAWLTSFLSARPGSTEEAIERASDPARAPSSGPPRAPGPRASPEPSLEPGEGWVAARGERSAAPQPTAPAIERSIAQDLGARDAGAAPRSSRPPARPRPSAQRERPEPSRTSGEQTRAVGTNAAPIIED